MRKCDELTNENSCLNNAADDEPIFVLKSTDELASTVVQIWASMYRKSKSEQPGGMTAKQVAKYHEAMQLAEQMDRWRAENKA